MTTKTVDVTEVPLHLAELLALVAQGTEIVLTQDDTPLARLVPATTLELPVSPTTNQRVADLFPGEIWTSEDFDDPLPDEFWLGNE